VAKTVVSVQCAFDVNGERSVEGSARFFGGESAAVEVSVGDELRGSPITLPFSDDARSGVVDFLTNGEMFFWKVSVLEPEEPYGDVCSIVSFSRDDRGVTLHLSVDLGPEKKHFETLIKETVLSCIACVFQKEA